MPPKAKVGGSGSRPAKTSAKVSLNGSVGNGGVAGSGGRGTGKWVSLGEKEAADKRAAVQLTETIGQLRLAFPSVDHSIIRDVCPPAHPSTSFI
jgi:hypothetical protein